LSPFSAGVDSAGVDRVAKAETWEKTDAGSDTPPATMKNLCDGVLGDLGCGHHHPDSNSGIRRLRLRNGVGHMRKMRPVTKGLLWRNACARESSAVSAERWPDAKQQLLSVAGHCGLFAEAAEWLGITERTFRRWKDRY
jgi:hypothetical protein